MPNKTKQTLLVIRVFRLAQFIDGLRHKPFVDDHSFVCERDLVDLRLDKLVLCALLHPHGHAKHDVGDPALEYSWIGNLSSTRLQL